MRAAIKSDVTEDEYLDFETTAERKHEYVNGRIYAMAGGDPVHSLLSANVIVALGVALRDRPCTVHTSDLRVNVQATTLFTYPDVTVVCGQIDRHPKSRTTIRNPVVVVEVLSPSTEAWDRGGKFAHYQKLPSLQEYVMVSQEGRRLERYRRLDTGEWALQALEGEGGSISLISLGVELRIDDVYLKVELAAPVKPPWAFKIAGDLEDS